MQGSFAGVLPSFSSISRRLIAATLIALSLPLTTASAATTTVRAISRADFLRAAISDLRIPLSTEGKVHGRVPAALAPYVRTAASKGVLWMFGDEERIDWTKTVTRGEAVQMLTVLTGSEPKKLLIFTDAKTNLEKKAASVAIENRWIRPLRAGLFGMNRVLTLAEEKQMLRRVGPAPVPVQESSSAPGAKDDVKDAVLQLLKEDYLYKDRLKLTGTGGVEGLVKELNDPYTTFMPPASTKQFNTTIDGELTGIGAQVEQRNGVLIIVTPLKDSPAEKAGLKSGDHILSVDGVSITGLPYVDAVDKVRGPKGSVAKMKILRDGINLDISVTRDVIKLEDMDIAWQGSVVTITLRQFGGPTDRTFRTKMEEVAAQNPTGIILDMRNNPGGLLHAAGVVLSTLLPDNTNFAEIHLRDDIVIDRTDGDPVIGAHVKLAVLVNRGTASAAEIVAGALQDAKRAQLVGEKTYGKGTVQQVIEFQDGSSLKMTVAEWRTPNGRKIDGVGIEPDYPVTESVGKDNVLSKAVELVR